MDFLLKTLSPKILLSLLPMILLKVGSWFKNKDANAVGSDDAFGNVLIAMAPVVQALDDGNEISVKKGLKAVRDTINNYLGE